MTPDPRPPTPPPTPPPQTPPGAPAPPPQAPPAPPDPAAGLGEPRPDLREQIVEVLETCFDPEIPVNIYDLGLVYGIDVTPESDVTIRMTLTSPACPVAESLPVEVQNKVRLVEGVRSAKVELVWEPPWGKHLLSEAARLQLGLDYY
jgi:FeS assembly SUF system protein